MKWLFVNVLVIQADPGGAPLGRPPLCSPTWGRAAVSYAGSGGGRPTPGEEVGTQMVLPL